ncbi:nuclear transport factor 2 family protein [Kineococcus glutinatus]|uniref:SnoaL-like domain-containing protein n=1 Tax=Kineococcus glutinatus TaxID=1070872 RepID=A0ABP9HWV8_9ACTN
MSTATGTRLQQVLDTGELTALVHRLGACLDEGRFDDLPDLLTEDATARTPGGTARGRDAVVAQARHNHGPDQRFQHVITDVLTAVSGDRARIRANVVLHVAPADPPAGPPPAPVSSMGGLYGFDAARTTDGWRLAGVEVTPLWRADARTARRVG